jgi:hypothetical protein
MPFARRVFRVARIYGLLVLVNAGYEPPVICTPEELVDDEQG